MRLGIRATAPLNARNERLTPTSEAGEVVKVEMAAPASTPVTWFTVSNLQIELTACNAFEFVLNKKENGAPFAHVGPNPDHTFSRNCLARVACRAFPRRESCSVGTTHQASRVSGIAVVRLIRSSTILERTLATSPWSRRSRLISSLKALRSVESTRRR
jgi:hypothetical protein